MLLPLVPVHYTLISIMVLTMINVLSLITVLQMVVPHIIGVRITKLILFMRNVYLTITLQIMVV